MKAIISTTYSDTYLYFLPIVTWAWNKLGVDVICFIPDGYSTHKTNKQLDIFSLAYYTSKNISPSFGYKSFICPEHKEATYAQCSRLYGACLDLPKEELLIIGDIDMAIFQVPIPVDYQDGITIFGSDLTNEGQYPMCYASGTVNDWRKAMDLEGKSYQQCLDELLGDIECENMRGNYWSKDQQELWEKLRHKKVNLIPRARPNTQFADHRVDRDDVNWRSYVNDELIDAHLWRNGYEEQNFANILELMRMKFPNEDFQWLIDYTQKYKELL